MKPTTIKQLEKLISVFEYEIQEYKVAIEIAKSEILRLKKVTHSGKK